ncbi:MAG: serine/threonine-protein kinase [Myxococcaceae bacterium]
MKALSAHDRLRLIAAAAICLRLQLTTLASRFPFIEGGGAAAMALHRWLLPLIGLGSAVALLAWLGTRKPTGKQLIEIGSAFLVLQTFVFCLADYRLVLSPSELRGLPIATMWMLAFPLLPSNGRATLITGLCAAVSGPLAMLSLRALGSPVPAFGAVLSFYWPLILGASFAATATWLLYRDTTPRKAAEVGDYHLEHKIGAGGMGEIWLARHSSLVRPAAVKLISPKISGKLSRERLERLFQEFELEAQTTAALRSPHTVQLYDFGRTKDGRLYYAMELLGGLDLERLVENHGPQPAGRVISILRQVCRSLAEAHAVGLIHGDVKSANLQLLIHGGEYDFVKVLDFGLAKDRRAGERAAEANTVRGTAAYLAPEIIKGTLSDERADLYALGCVAYELLTGELVFGAMTEPEMLQAQVLDTPVPPSKRARVAVPAELERLVMRLLSKEPTRRPYSAEQLLTQLDALASESPWTARDAERWWRDRLPEEVTRAQLRNPPVVKPARELPVIEQSITVSER